MQNVVESPIESLKCVATDRLVWARNFSDSLLATLRDDQLLSRAGGKGNHPLWVMGHLATSDDEILAEVSGRPKSLPEKFRQLFGGGSEPSDRRADYPSRGEVLSAMKATRQRLIDWVNSLDETTAHAPTPERIRAFAPDAISVPFTIVAHDLFHLGQVATVRASLGLAPVHG